MALNWFIKWCLIFTLFVEVRSQVCTKLIERTTKVPRTFSKLHKPCPSCGTTLTTEIINDIETNTDKVEECCDQFRRKNERLPPSSSNCEQVCESICHNGYCSAQNECVCYEGYEKHSILNTCIPKCDTGYKRNGDTCEPLCNKLCINGRCAAPETCVCNQGWEENERGECVSTESTCNPPCGHGDCVDSNKCACHNGYEVTEKTTCVPICRNCGGTCVAPGRCECAEYYKRKYVNADNSDCDCSENCDIMCYRTICVLLDITSTTVKPVLSSTVTTTLNNDLKDTSNKYSVNLKESNERKGEKKIAIRIVKKRPPTMHIPENTDLSSGRDLEIWQGIFIASFILMVSLSVLVIWELCRK